MLSTSARANADRGRRTLSLNATRFEDHRYLLSVASTSRLDFARASSNGSTVGWRRDAHRGDDASRGRLMRLREQAHSEHLTTLATDIRQASS
jgi:hypothetical protein